MATFIKIILAVLIAGSIFIFGTVVEQTYANKKEIQEIRQTLDSLEREFNRWRSKALIDEKYINEHVKGKKKQ